MLVRTLGWIGVASLLSISASAAELRITLSDRNQMPLAQFKNGQLVDGLLFEIGNSVARELKRSPKYMPLPRKRIPHALNTGEADLICHQHPQWLPGPFDWSQSFIPHHEIIISDQRQARPQNLSDLANVPIGTILGFNYFVINQTLGERFVRDDTLSTESNLRKLAAGHVNHIVIEQYVYEYQRSIGQTTLPIHPYLSIAELKLSCAVSRQGRLKIADLDKALAALQKRGVFTPMFERYRSLANP